ncbi:helix-turn-helix transcriptional regulator [Nocardiopsis sp. RSe5-2]|uniref:Helix-turn-helix transcriptional regulator n=1 Tax=Nocardiopsis endophytica TaxID=3018445 RepID=A0ABT4TXZ9_9ACTN|nr:helix-turn-helix transcriptional regulator [Nocardiopsis endophytica]MDA2809542.1 helix-turn-helix transcriptional regulator [Nocardiopsis endophytica]
MPRYSPTVRRRRLSLELRRLRESVGLTASQAAKQLEWDTSKITRMERNEWKRPNPRDIKDLLDLYRVDDQERREALVELARQSRQKGWWAAHDDLLGSGTYIGLEAEASAIRTFQLGVVPGLLQTAQYAEAITRGSGITDGEDVARRVAIRIERQKILEGERAPRLWAVIDEAALVRPVGGQAVMQAQIEHLIDVGQRLDNVDVQVLPLSAGAHAGLAGHFVLLEFQDDPGVVYVESATDGLYLETADDLRRYSLLYDHVHASALSVQQSRDYMKKMLR